MKEFMTDAPSTRSMESVLVSLSFLFIAGLIVLAIFGFMRNSAEGQKGQLEQLSYSVAAGDIYTVPLERDQFSAFAPLANDGFLVFQAPRDDTNTYLLCLERADGVVKALTGTFDTLGFTPEKLQPTVEPVLVARCENDI